jgi:hypothetical protein
VSRERGTWTTLLLLTVAAVVLAVLGPSWNDSSVGPAVAQETELPTVPADSVGEDFLTPARGPSAAPAVPGVADPADPADPPAAPDPASDSRRHRIEAGENDVIKMGQDVVVESAEHVLGHVVAMGGNVTVRGVVDKDVVAMGGDVVIEQGGTVRGDAVSVGGQVRRDPGASVLGSTVSVGHVPRGLFNWQTQKFVGQGIEFLQALFKLALWLLLAWLVVKLAEGRTARVIGRLEREPLASLGWGLVALVLVAPLGVAVALAAALLAITIIGIPVAIVLVMGYIVGLVLLGFWGGIVGASAVGGWLVRRLAPRLGEPSLVRNTLWGGIAVAAPGVLGHLFKAVGFAVPPALILGGMLQVLGGLLTLGVIVAGAGAILRTRAGQPAPLPGIAPMTEPSPAPPVPPAPPAPAGPYPASPS